MKTPTDLFTFILTLLGLACGLPQTKRFVAPPILAYCYALFLSPSTLKKAEGRTSSVLDRLVSKSEIISDLDSQHNVSLLNSNLISKRFFSAYISE